MRRGRWADRRAGGDRGSASVWTAVAAAALCAVFLALLAMSQAVLARHRAGGAADLAALAAADHALLGPEAACGVARRVADAQRAAVVACEVTGGTAEVAAEAGAGPYTVRVRSRAGPASTAGTAVDAEFGPSGGVVGRGP
ncbi:Rv3654c family TadE-like protein [Streptomyces mobaraensis]|uniref:Flp pilus-assembly TadE/G-like family protein n=1 Tax=Streptomyces mobaraensis TaxID=35621 RepID=A0A5N5WAI5_STRMB|nr:Rv3654c family TadE-like protein [Streptomyces mobaraensis]KAB7847718.1 flp pilus-assembly TadE/G-like family protein [Streptomyces mobaraensis]